MERGFKGTEIWIGVFGQFGASGSQSLSNRLDAFYEQLSIKSLMEDPTR